ncbi:hypothetical protein BJ944DRAFT_243377 [Cunninghamella echinulata]|nr:hypothetical protein BJ944DRAFT_243377 [Cunninghamella echinulata]
MRPDEHKSKDSRRYQQRKKKQGDNTAAEIAEERKRRARAQDKGIGIAAIKRRNGETPTTTAANNKSSGQFSRRKILSNRDRYTERSLQDDLEQDAELGIDRETTDLVNMLEDAENNLTGGSTYFKFKEEQILTPLTTATTIDNEMYQTLLQVDFNALEKKFQQVETRVLLGLSPDDTELIDCAFEHDYIGLDKPLIPTLNKTSQGAILFKSPIVEKHPYNQKDGIYIRNDRQQSNVATINNIQQHQQNTNVDKEDDKGKI